MTQQQVESIFSLISQLQCTVQLLSEKVDGRVLSVGNGTGFGKNCDDVGGETEQPLCQQSCVDGDESVREHSLGLECDGVAEGDSGGGVRKELGREVKDLVLGSLGCAGGKGAEVKQEHHGPERVDSGVSSSGGTSSTSWSDMVEEEEEAKRVSLVRDELGASFYRDYVRISAVKDLRGFLSKRGVVLKRECFQDLALVRYTTATVPVVFADGRQRIKTSALLGDKFMTAIAVEVLSAEKKSAPYIQEYLSRVLSRSALSSTCVNSGLGRHIVAPSGVDMAKTSVGGEAFEAIAGVVYRSGGVIALRAFMTAMQLL